eukprot:CAMPEP_0172735122 /NCGR_PEP_ID=MMETSP1074-20121228/111716_1 /TAXON_ID=2916 /ORGANISM="Ceratium fusus, Strain PA161109" /LENGTH=190 /DNA_ID=CAMNT_0013564051 /DNA_START=145 /DNA_END=714 /DNA_ORIENTATION=-
MMDAGGEQIARGSDGSQGQDPPSQGTRRGRLRKTCFVEGQSYAPKDDVGEGQGGMADRPDAIVPAPSLPLPSSGKRCRRKQLPPSGATGDDLNTTLVVPPPPLPRPRRGRRRLTHRGDDPNKDALVPPPPVPHAVPRPRRGRPDTGTLVSQVLDEAPLDKMIKPGSEDERWVRNHPLWIKITQRGYPLPF